MDKEFYYQLIRYLAQGVVPKQGDDWRKKSILRSRTNFEYDGENGVLYKISPRDKNYRRIVIPAHRVRETLLLSHEHPLAGHQGVNRTLDQVAQVYWWPQMKQDVQEHIRTCDRCQKRNPKKDEIPRQASKTPDYPFQHIGIDVMGPLPRTMTGKRYIVLAIDWLTKWPEAQAIETADAQTIAVFIHERIICQHGPPQQITSDRGTEFCNDLITELNRTYRVQHIRTTAYHPQGNGLTERMNQTVKNTMSKLIDSYDNWDHWLSSALFAIRSSPQKTTTFSPFELVYGRLPNRGVPPLDMRQSQEERIWSIVTHDIDRLNRIRKKARNFIQKAQDRQTTKSQEFITMGIGDQVLLYRNIVEASWSAKLEPKWEGPYLVQKIKGTSVWLRKTDGTILPNPVHRSKIKKYHVRSN